MLTGRSILWRRLDRPGHEAARLVLEDGLWRLAGTAVFLHEQRACRLDYLVVCNSAGETLSGRVAGWIGPETVKVEIVADEARRWQINGRPAPAVEGCLDLDLNFSPSTNLLPLRRLQLDAGAEAQVTAAWLRFPSFTLEPLAQRYRRLGSATYLYESGGGSFRAELRVDESGFVIHYPGFCQAEPVA